MFDIGTTNRLDRLCRQHTAFRTFEHLVDAKGGYRPTIRCRGTGLPTADRPRLRDLTFLADAYDLFQSARGDDRRAYRG